MLQVSCHPVLAAMMVVLHHTCSHYESLRLLVLIYLHYLILYLIGENCQIASNLAEATVYSKMCC